MRSIRDSRRVLAGILAGILFVLLLLAPAALRIAAAQTAVPTVAATAAPTVTPTKTPAELIGIGEEQATLSELLARYGIPGAVLALLLIAGFFVLSSLAKKTGEGIGDYLYRAFLGRRLDRRIKTLDQQTERREAQQAQAQALDAGIAAYLDWLQDELKYLPRIPIRSTDQRDQLLLEEVYVPLRVVEREQIEQYRTFLLGQFDLADEANARDRAFGALEQSQRVYGLLSDTNPRATPPPRQRAPRRRTASDQDLLDQMLATQPPGAAAAPARLVRPITCLLLVGDAGSGKTTTLHFGALALRTQQAAFEFNELIVLARKTRAKQRLLTEADARLEQVRLYLRLAHDLKLLTLRQYEHVSREVSAVGALLGDWIKRMSGSRSDMH